MEYIKRCDKDTVIGELWNVGKSLDEIGKILEIKFLYKNKATGKDVSLGDFSRTILNGLMEYK